MKLFKKKSDEMTSKPSKGSSIAFKGGAYSVAVTVVVLAILIVVNVLASFLPTSVTQHDISSSQLYSVTSSTKAVLGNLEDDVTIYWIVQSGKEDSVISNLLDQYTNYSDHVTVEKIDPDAYPTFAEQYTDDTVSNNSLVVECGDRNRYIDYNDIYIQDVDYTTYSYVYSFDGEGSVTSAIDYVTNTDFPQLYVLSGHGEQDISSVFSDQITKENIQTQTFSLLNENAVPDDCDAVLINAPQSDISDVEREILADYVANGGKLMVIAGPVDDAEFPNLNSLLSDYGVTANEGVVVESDSNYYAFQAPYVLMPQIESGDITDPLTENNYYVLMPVSTGLTVGSTDNGTVTELLTTSESSYSKVAGYDLTTYDREDGDIDGPFALAVQIESNGGGQMIWISSSQFLDEQYNSYSSGANLDFAMNALSSLTGSDEASTIRTKSLGYNYLTISDTVSGALKVVMIVVIPLAFVAVGVVVIVQRRKKRYEKA